MEGRYRKCNFWLISFKIFETVTDKQKTFFCITHVLSETLIGEDGYSGHWQISLQTYSQPPSQELQSYSIQWNKYAFYRGHSVFFCCAATCYFRKSASSYAIGLDHISCFGCLARPWWVSGNFVCSYDYIILQFSRHGLYFLVARKRWLFPPFTSQTFWL